jgi:hypothetical protein
LKKVRVDLKFFYKLRCASLTFIAWLHLYRRGQQDHQRGRFLPSTVATGAKMQAMQTFHSTVRAQQRGVPRLIQNWLLDYGAEQFDGRGGVVRYFSNACLRKMERDLGKTSLKRMSEYLRCYLVQSSSDGVVITVGKRHENQHIWRH